MKTPPRSKSRTPIVRALVVVAVLAAVVLAIAAVTASAGGAGGSAVDATPARAAPARAAATPLAPSVAAGGDFSLAVETDGRLWSWGTNSDGQLGRPTDAGQPTNVPVQVGMSADWAVAAAGDRHGLAIGADGALWSWGSNSSGQLGRKIDAAHVAGLPGRVGTDTGWSAAAGGLGFTLALQRDGTLWSWGINSHQQLGRTIDAAHVAELPGQVGAAKDWAAIACGGRTGYALKRDGTLWSWGNNIDGQLGRTPDAGHPAGTPSQVGGGHWAAISAGDSFAVGIGSDGRLWSWGENDVSQLGRVVDALHPAGAPGLVASDGAWIKVACGGYCTVAVQSDRTLWSWGRSAAYFLGRPIAGGTDPGVPGLIGGEAGWSTPSCGSRHALVLRAGATLMGWGWNETGAVGIGSVQQHVDAPVEVAQLDVSGPVTSALKAITVKKGAKATFRYKVVDYSPAAQVTIRVYKGKARKKTLTVGSVPTGSPLKFVWTCSLPKGSYTWRVGATDLAGNVQAIAGKSKLTVK